MGTCSQGEAKLAYPYILPTSTKCTNAVYNSARNCLLARQICQSTTATTTTSAATTTTASTPATATVTGTVSPGRCHWPVANQ